jgi:hypothetical protein
MIQSMIFNVNGAMQLVAWGILTAVQPWMPTVKNGNEYDSIQAKMCIQPISSLGYVLVFIITHSCALASIFLANFTVTLFVLFVIFIFFDKLWFYTFFTVRNATLTVMNSFILLAFSVAFLVLMGLPWVGFLWIPMITMLTHGLVVLMQWDWHKWKNLNK